MGSECDELSPRSSASLLHPPPPAFIHCPAICHHSFSLLLYPFFLPRCSDLVSPQLCALNISLKELKKYISKMTDLGHPQGLQGPLLGRK